MTVTPTSPTTPTRVRHVLGAVDQIPRGEGLAFAVDGEQVAVFRLRDGSVRAVSAVCPHQGGPIADGQIDNHVVLCPLHMNAFDLATGECLTGAPPLRSYEVFVDDDGAIVLLRPTGVTGSSDRPNDHQLNLAADPVSRPAPEGKP